MRYAFIVILFLGLSSLCASIGESQPAPVPALGQNAVTVGPQATTPGQFGLTVPSGVTPGTPAIGGFGAVPIGNPGSIPGANTALGQTALAPAPNALATPGIGIPPPPVALAVPAPSAPGVEAQNALSEEPGGDG